MPSWNAPSLTNYIRDDIPAIHQLVNAVARWTPEGYDDIICTEVAADFKRLVESAQTDTTITKNMRFERFNGQTWKSIGKLMHDVDMLDGYHASKTSDAENFIPVYNSNKKIAGGAEGEAGKAIQLSNTRTFDIGGIASADAQQFDGTTDVTIPINQITVNNEGDSALNGIITKAHGGTGNAHGYATDVEMQDATGGQILARQYGQLGESKLVNSTDIKSLVVPGNYVSRTVDTDYGFPYTDTSLTAYINVSKSGNSIIQRINMGGNNLWVNTSNDGGKSWLGLKPIGGAKQGSLTVYVSKSGSALNSGFDPTSPILSIEHAIQIFYDFARGYSNSVCKLCVGEGDWGSFTFRGLPFDLSIYPFDGLGATEFTNSLPKFHGLTASMGTKLLISGVVTDFISAQHASLVYVTDYCRVGSITAVMGSFAEVTSTAKIGVFNQSTTSNAILHAFQCSSIMIANGASITIEENVSKNYFINIAAGSRVMFQYPAGTPINKTATFTGKRYYISQGSELGGAATWGTYLPGTAAGILDVNGLMYGIPYGGDDPNTFLCADLTWKKVTTLPSLSVTGDTVLDGKLTVKGDFIIGSTSFLDKVYPVGSIYMSVNSTSPATLFGGTWEQIAGGRVLMGANSTYTLGSTGGSATHTLSADEMPTHTHAGSSGGAGGHSHTLGSMNATGRVQAHASAAIAQNEASGVFSMPSLGGRNIDTGGGNSAGGLDFTLNRNFAGASSTVSNHTHTITVKNTGGGKAHNNMQPYLVVNIWKRTA